MYIRNIITTTCYSFAFLLLIFIPFEIFPYQQALSDFLFKNILIEISTRFFHLNLVNPDISSDSTLLYLLTLVLFIVSIFSGFAFSSLKKYNNTWPLLKTALTTLFSYYLSLILFKYGFDKVFKAQFYLPEPNLLYTPFGQLDQDILYWSTMGTSYSYNLFLGGVEVIAAILILYNRTRVTGLFISLFILLNVAAINMCFDISVKLFSFFLLYLNLVCLFPHLITFLNIFIYKRTVLENRDEHSYVFMKKRWIKTGLKIIVVLFIFSQTLYPYLRRGNYNDDLSLRPYLHGAYEVNNIQAISDTGELNIPPIKRFFIHRAGFIIFQDKTDAVQDYKLDIDNQKGNMILTDYELNTQRLEFSYAANDSCLNLQYFYKDKEFLIKSKALNWRKLPALQSKFHLRMDEE